MNRSKNTRSASDIMSRAERFSIAHVSLDHDRRATHAERPSRAGNSRHPARDGGNRSARTAITRTLSARLPIGPLLPVH